MHNKTVLVLNKICPFAERAWLTLQQKKIPYELKEVSLTNKDAQFTETYKKAFGHDPTSDGKVPILLDGDKTLTESDLISWYLSEKHQTGTQLIPHDPFDRLRLRWFVGNFGKLIGAFYGFKGYLKKSKEEQDKQLQSLDKILQQFNDALVLPYALGDKFTLADILIYPWFPRWAALQKHVGVSIDKKFTKISEWLKHVQERDSAKVVRQTDQFYIKGYSGYF